MMRMQAPRRPPRRSADSGISATPKQAMIAMAVSHHALQAFDASVRSGRLERGIADALRLLDAGDVAAATARLRDLQTPGTAP